MRLQTLIPSVLLLLGLSLGLSGCAEDGPPRIAVLLPLSGEDAVYGEPVRKGVLLAHEEIQRHRSAGLYPWDLQLEVLDTQGDPERATRLLTEQYDNGAVAAVGGVTDAEAAALAPVAEEAGRVLLSPTASRPDLPTSRHFFRLSLPADREGTKMASFAALELGLRQAVILAAEDGTARAAAKAFQEELERNHGEVLGRWSYPAVGSLSATRLREVVRHAVDEEPQALYLADFSPRCQQMLEMLDRQGFRGVILTTSGLTAPELLAATREVADGTLVTQTMFDPESTVPKVELFVDAYRERWQGAPDLYAAHGYDALQVLAQALIRDNARAPRVWKGLRGLDEYRGVTGFVQFDAQGQVGQFARVYVVDGGRLDPVEGMPDWRKERLARRLP